MQIVVGVDGSRSADNAVAWAAGAARALGAELLLVTVVAPGADAEACERHLLAEWSHAAQEARAPFRTEVLVGDPRLELSEVAAHAGAPLVVVGAGHERWFPALHLGSTSHYLAQHSDRSVAIVPELHTFDAGHMVVGVDGSEGSAAATRWAAWMAQGAGGDVTAVHAWQRSPARVSGATGGANSAEDAARMCRAWSTELDAAGVLAGSVAMESAAVEALLKTVAEVGAGVLVLGTRGAGGFLSLRLGSVALHVLQEAHVPTVLVPPGR
jgi:nucleotide-binding universal stress UspA family protein